MRFVVGLGGKALLQRADKPDAGVQLIHVPGAAQVLAPLVNEDDVLSCHGHGPQVGMLALESASDPLLSRPYPLDDLVAQTQGMIGYWLIQSLRNAGVGKLIHGWSVAADGDHWRRVVASPEPQRIGGSASIGSLTDADALLAGTAGTTISNTARRAACRVSRRR